MINENQNLLGKEVLIVGGDVDFVNSLETAFLYVGADVFVETVDVKGVSTAKNKRPDVILFESSIAGMSCGDFIEVLREDSLTKDVPVILITKDDKQDEGSDGSCSAILKKDMDLAEIMSAVEKALGSSLVDSSDETIDISELADAPVLDESNKDLRVLVIEDDPLLRSLLSARLVKSKIPYQFCHNGNDAIESIRLYKPTVVILDIMLPGMSGLDVLEEMRGTKSMNDIPVVIFSNKDNGEDRDRAAMLGVNAFLVKAMTDLNDLVSLIIKQK